MNKIIKLNFLYLLILCLSQICLLPLNGKAYSQILSCPAEAGLLQGTSISPVSVTASGGDGNYSYSIQPAGSGLSINNNGLITSAPLNTLGWLNYTVTVTDGSGATDTCSSRLG